MQTIKHTGLALVFGCAAMLVTPLADAGHRRHGNNDAAIGIAVVLGAAALISASRDHHRQSYAGSGYGGAGYGRYGYAGSGYGGAAYSNYGPGYDNAGFSTTVVGGYHRGNPYPSAYGAESYADQGYSDYGHETGHVDDSYDSQGFDRPEYYDEDGAAYCDDGDDSDYGYTDDDYP
ncbi:MAG: hypothetical protein H7A19_11265 [Rhodanobacteraceae bacterium]|nr:hypothetical protein [Rhodanobacteraceae bacterium]